MIKHICKFTSQYAESTTRCGYFQLPACTVIAARESHSTRLYVFFKHNIVWKFSFDLHNILTGSYSSEKDIFPYHADLDGRYPDSACIIGGHLVFFFGMYS